MWLYSGTFYNRCRISEAPLTDGTWPIDTNYPRPCSMNKHYGYQCPTTEDGVKLYCGNAVEGGLTLEEDGVYHDAQI